MIKTLRFHIGRLMIWYGYKTLPPGTRAGVQALIAVGYEWAKANEPILDEIIKEAAARGR